MPSKNPVPKYCRHPNGQAYLYHRSVPTKDHKLYLGKHGSEESLQRYRQFLRRLELGLSGAAAPAPNEVPLVLEVVAAYLDYAEGYYRREDGTISREYENQRYASSYLTVNFGEELASDFGPKALKSLQILMVKQGLVRTYINRTVSRIKRLFKWAASEELIDASTYHALACVAYLQPGQHGVRESKPVTPATELIFNPLLPFVADVIADMLQVQYYCAMRPNEVCKMRGCDIDRSGDIWIYRPEKHKNSWRGKSLFKAIPKAVQHIIAKRMLHGGEFLFPPSEGIRWSLEQRQSKSADTRKTKRYPCEIRRLEREKQQRRRRAKHKSAGPHYTTASYRKAIDYGIERAAKGGVVVEHFSPNQLRHAIITFIAGKLSQQKAQRYAGHEHLDTTAIYTEKDIAEMIDVARQLDELWGKAS